MDKSRGGNSRGALVAGTGIVTVVTVVLLSNSPPTAPPVDIAAVWSGTLSLLLLMLNSIHRRLRVLDSRIYSLARDVSELRGRRRWRRAR